ncbi:MAG: histone deacetylase family protein [Alphaproteobacteria bacterium]|nr:histone deacetylase family protein [Alphaproteobacteria bacterium]
MIRIHRVIDDTLPRDARSLTAAVTLLEGRFPDAPAGEFAKLGPSLRDPLRRQLRTLLYVAEDHRGQLRGCAVVQHDPGVGYVYLDWLASAVGETGGVGAALWGRVFDDAARLEAVGVFLECLPDEPDSRGRVPEHQKDNRRRLAFYERHGARPIIGTAYETPVKEGDHDLPYLVVALCRPGALPASVAQRVARSILEKKYAGYCPPEYVEKVVDSFRDPIQLRPSRHAPPPLPDPVSMAEEDRIALVVFEGHGAHHIRERGYVEAPARVDRIRAVLEGSGRFAKVEPRRFPRTAITAVHDPKYVSWLENVAETLEPGNLVYPYVFPVRNAARMPEDLAIRAGYWCIDTFTPLHRDVASIARGAAETALTAAQEVLNGRRVAYALVRPPGHHAERALYGGFCYFNNAAIAAQHLRTKGVARVAMLDLDYHHGNGQQDIFYRRSDVLTVSLHGNPKFAYPYFAGFADETGEAEGEGFNLNIPLPEHLDGEGYCAPLRKALDRVRSFDPGVLVVCLGLDPAKNDPTGTWSLREADFRANGRAVGQLRRPTLVVQEGGYGLRVLGRHALAFLTGLHEEMLS